MTAHNHGRVSPFGHPRINAQLTTPRGISQSPTSFIGSSCQGIHRAPLTHNTKNASDEHKKYDPTQSQTAQSVFNQILTKLHQKRRYSRPLYSSQTTQSQGLGTPTTTTHQRVHRPQEPQQKQPCSPHAVPDTQQRNEPSSHTIATRRLKQNGLISTRIQKKGLKHPCWCENHKIKLLRKEVIQPHLPVRLPCYDFVPIADPTFDSSLTSLGHWLRVLPTFMT